jgi:hypothetical protein
MQNTDGFQPMGVQNLGFGTQNANTQDAPYAQLYTNWVNQLLAPYQKQYGQQQPQQVAQMPGIYQDPQIQNYLQELRRNMNSSQWRSGGNP